MTVQSVTSSAHLLFALSCHRLQNAGTKQFLSKVADLGVWVHACQSMFLSDGHLVCKTVEVTVVVVKHGGNAALTTVDLYKL